MENSKKLVLGIVVAIVIGVIIYVAGDKLVAAVSTAKNATDIGNTAQSVIVESTDNVNTETGNVATGVITSTTSTTSATSATSTTSATSATGTTDETTSATGTTDETN